MRNRLFVAVVIVASVVTVGAQPNPVLVFVTSVGAEKGFRDPNKDNQDTVKDLRGAIKGHKRTLALTEDRSEARIVLVVMKRDMTPAAESSCHQAKTALST